MRVRSDAFRARSTASSSKTNFATFYRFLSAIPFLNPAP
jgi:hypothetical protein